MKIEKIYDVIFICLNECDNDSSEWNLPDYFMTVHSVDFRKLSHRTHYQKHQNLQSMYKGHIDTILGIYMLKESDSVFEELINKSYNFGSLTNLSLQCSTIKNLNGIIHLKNLKILDLQACYNLETVRGISLLTNLEALHMSEWDIKHVNEIVLLTKLKTLTLRLNYSIRDVGKLTRLTTLTALDMSDCYELQNLNLHNLTNLVTLDLSRSKIKNVNGISSLTNLTSLSLNECNRLKNLDGLARLTNLQVLDLWDCNNLQNRNGIARLRKLKRFNL